MRFGVTPAVDAPVTSKAFLLGYTQAAEDLGFDTVWFPDHVVKPASYESQYPYAERFPYEDVPLADPLILMAAVAAVTQKIRLGTSILVLPQRNPVVLAKQVATLDVISDGRVDLGVGAGWLREEFEAIGAPWERRGQRTDEHIEAMRAMWTQPEASYHGELVRFDRLICDPKPVQPGGVPIIIGGHSPAAARRAGRLGDGFMPMAFGRKWREVIAEMRAAAEQAGRDPDAIELIGGGVPDPAIIEKQAAMGISRVSFQTQGNDLPSSLRSLEQVARAVMATA